MLRSNDQGVCIAGGFGVPAGPDAIEEFEEKLATYKTSKGAIQFPNDREIPLELVTEIAKWSYEKYKK